MFRVEQSHLRLHALYVTPRCGFRRCVAGRHQSVPGLWKDVMMGELAMHMHRLQLYGAIAFPSVLLRTERDEEYVQWRF